MDKLKMKTPNLADERYAALAALFPNAVTETIDENGVTVRAIDADILRQEINTRVVGGQEERYQFTWPDKKKAVILANAPIAATLRPCREESVNFDTTGNLYIEGDNLEVLKLLRETYLNSVKMIYIDPPYNTGDDYVYADDFSEKAGAFLRRDGQYDEDGNRLVKNPDGNGRFHTDWLNMIFPRLRVARDLLADDGVIFISIDEGEAAQLRKVCDELFGEGNLVAVCVRKRRDSQANLSRNISRIHEYVMIYAKKSGYILNKIAPSVNEKDYKNPDNDPRGPYTTMPCTNKGGQLYSITTPAGVTITDEWRFKKETYDGFFSDNRIVFPRGGEGKPRYKLFLSEKLREGALANTWLDGIASNQEGTREIKALFDKPVFDNPKPVGFMKYCLRLGGSKDGLILDFFSGSASSAHAAMLLNAEDGGGRKFIMVQLPEVCPPGSEAAKAGYATICEIGKERMRRAGRKIIEASKPGAETLPDVGFRVLKLDSGNMKDVYYTPREYARPQFDFDGLVDNVKGDRTDEDLLFQAMLDLGIPLSSRLEVGNINGAAVHYVNGGYLIACFERVDEAIITAIARSEPYYAVFRDHSFVSDGARVNFEQIFMAYSPTTRRKAL